MDVTASSRVFGDHALGFNWTWYDFWMDSTVVRRKENSNSPTSPGKKWDFLEHDPNQVQKRFAEGSLDLENLSAYIQSKETGLTSPETIMEILVEINGNEQALEIIRFHLDLEVSVVSQTDLASLLTKYPDPQDFILASKPLLEREETQDFPSLVQWETNLKSIVTSVYGERATTLNNLLKQKLEGFNNYPEVNAKRVISKAKILEKTNPEEQLTVDDLEKLGLGPKVSIVEKDVVFHLSAVFSVPGEYERSAVIAYIEKDGEMTVCPFYRSNSHGVWKLLPATGKNVEVSGLHISRYFSKGFSEESVTAPLALQQHLTIQEESVFLDKDNYNKVLFGTSAAMSSQDIRDAYRVGYYEESTDERRVLADLQQRPEIEDQPYFKEVNNDPIFEIVGQKASPESFKIMEKFRPVFSSGPVTSWESQSKKYGSITYEVFRNSSQTLNYIFCHVEDEGLIWLAAIDPNSSMTKAGVRKSWVKANEALTPAIDHGKNGDYELVSDFVEQIPVVQTYANYLQKQYDDEMERLVNGKG